jgi:4-amino-4-deoxy-L-arabinose transferase-like glycosyltransferase
MAACVCGTILFLFLYRLDDRDLWSSHEARAAQDAQTILDSGDWVVPRLYDGQPELQKPPLYYWLVAGIAWLRGGPVDALAERLPAALGAIGTCFLLLLALRARGRLVAGVLTALLLATAQHFTWIGRTGRIDVPLTFTVTAATLGLRSDLRRWQIGGYLAIVAGILLKGPIGAVLPAVILAAERLLRSRTDESRRSVLPSLCWGAPLVFCLTAPWFIAAHIRTDSEFTQVFFWYHHVQRATGGAETLPTHPWWTYGVRIAVDGLPWSPLLLPAVIIAFRTSWLRDDTWARLGLVWLLAVTAMLSLSRFKRADYLLPAYPGLAILLGCLGERAYHALSSTKYVRWLTTGLVSACAAAILTWGALHHTLVSSLDAERTKLAFAAEIRAIAPLPEQVLFFRVEDHLLAFHLGRPLNTFLEWENFDIWAGRPGAHYVVMPADCANLWRQYISSGTLDEVIRFTDRSDRQRPRHLVLVRTHANGSVAGATGSSAAHFARGDQRASAAFQSSWRTQCDR